MGVTVDGTHRLPIVGAGFVWDDADGTSPPVLRPEVPGVNAAFTTRLGGTSSAPYDELNLSFRVGDDTERVRANREIAGRTVGASGRWSVVAQVHGSVVVDDAPSPGEVPEADGLVCRRADATLAVFGADCVPVLAVSADRQTVGVAHAGWRGLAAGIVSELVRAVGEGATVVAGPSIGACCYEVGSEVREVFVRRFGDRAVADGRADLWAAAAIDADRAGAASFAAAGLCTACHPALFFSHRRDRGRTGRQALLARLEGRT